MTLKFIKGIYFKQFLVQGHNLWYQQMFAVIFNNKITSADFFLFIHLLRHPPVNLFTYVHRFILRTAMPPAPSPL